MHEKINDADISRSFLTRGMTLVEWLCRASKELSYLNGHDAYLDWVTVTLRALIDRSAMVTEVALSIAEHNQYDERGSGDFDSDVDHKASLMVYMLAQCPSIVTRTPQLNCRHDDAESYGGTKPMLDYYAERATDWKGYDGDGDRSIANEVLCGLVDSPDVYDALSGENRWSPEPYRRLVALEKSGTARRPPPINPEVGVTHVEGGPFSRWHARHERWVAEVADRLLNGEDPDEVLNGQDRDLLNETILGLCL